MQQIYIKQIKPHNHYKVMSRDEDHTLTRKEQVPRENAIQIVWTSQ